MSKQPLITSRTDWTEQLITEIYKHCEEIAVGDLELDVYPNQLEIITAEHMIDAYASTGMPVNYHHWSFGKVFLKYWNQYQRGRINLALEMVLNSDPCIAYLMEDNDAIAQALVIAHACFGHNFVHKNNYLYNEYDMARSIIDYLIFAKNYIRECEEKYGLDVVERVLDAAHAISIHGIDKSRRRHKKSLSEDELKVKVLAEEDDKQKHLDIILQTTSTDSAIQKEDEIDLDKVDDEENLVYFIYKKAPNMEPWKREILRIVYKINQYFYPQSQQSQVLNEGMATFTHFYIMNELERKGIISSDAQLAWLQLHSSVIYQPDMHSRRFQHKFNPYALGFDIYKEIHRVCTEPTKEDEEWFPRLAGTDWRAAIRSAASDYRDDSFIEQFMTPALIRKYRLMIAHFDDGDDIGKVIEIADDNGYRNIRRIIAEKHNRIDKIPEISINAAKMRSDRTLTIEYKPYRNRSLFESYATKTLAHIRYLWGYDVELVCKNPDDPDIYLVLDRANESL